MINIKIKQDSETGFDFLKSKLQPKDSLFQGVWIGTSMNPDVAERLIEIADSVLESMEINVAVQDIIVTGSIASYNWHDLSDIDLHIILDFSAIDENRELVKRMLDQSRINWNKTHNIFIEDKEVEIYFQDTNETHEANGIWSLMKSEWLLEPQKIEMNVDLNGVEKKAETFARAIEHVEDLISSEEFKDANEYASRIKKKISRMRKAGLQEGGIYSPENLAFKMLRNAQWLARLSNAKIKSYDKMMSLKLNETNDTIEEIKDYFENIQDEDYMKYSDHPLSSVESLMDPDIPAPWDEEYEGLPE